MEGFMQDVESSRNADAKKTNRLKNLDLFVLDNSMRETTVGSLKAHTIENKRHIYEIIKECGFKHFIVESFNHQTRIGDVFLKELIAKKEDLSNAFAFSEVWELVDKDSKVPLPDIPIGLKKCKEFGIPNVFLEFDLSYYGINYEEFDMDKLCAYFKDKCDWIRQNISSDSLILVNMRDFSQTMTLCPERIGHFVNFVSSLPDSEKIFGLAFEDLGKILPETMGAWTEAVRNEMDRCGWSGGHLLFHQHEQWGVMHSSNLEVLAKGATGMWAGVCVEGAAMGHADTCTAIFNLIRLGNTKVQNRYNCKYLRNAAIALTKIVTGNKPPPRQPIYGRRSLDLVFGFLFSDPNAKGGFDLAEFLGMKRKVRISNMANNEMILMKLKEVFGENPEFTLEMAGRMKDQMLVNAKANRKEEYNSNVGLALLFDQAGGSLTTEMAAIINKNSSNTPYIDTLIEEIKNQWNEFDDRDGERDDRLNFLDFYNGFLAPYFGCYRCEDSQKGLQALDLDGDGGIDWIEFRTFLVWAGRQYPHVPDAQSLLDKAFRKGVIPAMADEVEKARKK